MGFFGVGEMDEWKGFWGFMEPVLANPAEIERSHFWRELRFLRKKKHKRVECEIRVLEKRREEKRKTLGEGRGMSD